jgi:hypothetical protein
MSEETNDLDMAIAMMSMGETVPEKQLEIPFYSSPIPKTVFFTPASELTRPQAEVPKSPTFSSAFSGRGRIVPRRRRITFKSVPLKSKL